MLNDLVQRGEGGRTVSLKVSWCRCFVSWISNTRLHPIIEPFWGHGCSHAHCCRETIYHSASQIFLLFTGLFCVSVVSNWCSLKKEWGEKMFRTNKEKDEHYFFCSTYLVLLSCGFFPFKETPDWPSGKCTKTLVFGVMLSVLMEVELSVSHPSVSLSFSLKMEW